MKKINWDSIWGYYLLISTFSENLSFDSLDEAEKRLRKISDLRKKKLKMSLSLRKHLFGGTLWWEKLKFSEKSQIWEYLSVGGPEDCYW